MLILMFLMGCHWLIKDTADNVTKSIFSEYHSGNHYHIPKAVLKNADGVCILKLCLIHLN